MKIQSFIKEIFDLNYDKARQFKKDQAYELFFKEIRSKFKYLCIFGAGMLGQEIYLWLKKSDIKVDFFCDNNIQNAGKEIMDGTFCNLFECLESKKEDVYIIVAVANKSAKYCDEINQQLTDFPHVYHNPFWLTAYWASKPEDYDISKKEMIDKAVRIYRFLEDLHSKELFLKLLELRLLNIVHNNKQENPIEKYYDPHQYWVRDLFSLHADESIVDCGAYIGDTLENYIRDIGDFESYYCFELDENHFVKLEKCIERQDKVLQDKIFAFPYGVYSKEEKVEYVSVASGGSAINADNWRGGGKCGSVVDLNTFLHDKKITFIKMDIENSELEALKGAKKIIFEQTPILAISIYHSFNQFLEIPLWIKRIDINYKLYIRQHKTTFDDTICYAIPNCMLK